MTDKPDQPQPLPAGALCLGVPHTYVNLFEVAVVDGEDMVRLAFGAKTGPEGITRGPVVLMREAQAEAWAKAVLALIDQRQKRAYNQAMGNKPQ